MKIPFASAPQLAYNMLDIIDFAIYTGSEKGKTNENLP
jgi:hypothetical protein